MTQLSKQCYNFVVKLETNVEISNFDVLYFVLMNCIFVVWYHYYMI